MDKWDPFDTSSVSVPPDSNAPRDPGWPGTTATLDWLSGPSQDPVPVLPVASTEPGPSIYPALPSVGGAAAGDADGAGAAAGAAAGDADGAGAGDVVDGADMSKSTGSPGPDQAPADSTATVMAHKKVNE